VPERRRIAVTGIGPVTPIGTGVEDFWAGLVAGRSGAGPITRFDATDFKSRVAAEIHDFEITDYLPPKNARRLDRFAQLAYAAATLALADAGMKATDPDPARVGMVIGSGIGGIGLWEEEHTKMLKRGPRFVSPSLIAMMIPNAAAGSLAIDAYVNRAYTRLPYGVGTTVRRTLGNGRGGGYEWVGNGLISSHGIIAVELDAAERISRFTATWDASRLDDAAVATLLTDTLEH